MAENKCVVHVEVIPGPVLKTAIGALEAACAMRDMVAPEHTYEAQQLALQCERLAVAIQKFLNHERSAS